MQFKCRKSKVQEYNCCVSKIPFWKKQRVSFDKCLTSELFFLWDLGIVTTGVCCSRHLHADPNQSYIGVEEKFIPQMKKLGYKVRINNMDKTREDSFIPKTIL